MSGFARHWGSGARQALLLHCSLAHSGAWGLVAERLTPGRKLTAPDLVGHGEGPDFDPSRDLHDQCFEALLPHLPAGEFDLIGHSFGATLALRLALQFPDRIRSLCLIEPVLFAAAKGSGRFSPHLVAVEEFGMAINRDDLSRATEEFLKLWGAGVRFEHLPKAQRDYMVERIHLIAASEPALFDDTADLVPRLGQIGAPTLLLQGANCLPVTSAILDRIEAEITQTERHAIPGAGHMAPVTHPTLVAELIEAHLTRTAQGRAA